METVTPLIRLAQGKCVKLLIFETEARGIRLSGKPRAVAPDAGDDPLIGQPELS
jgi:hypothetical protein